MKAVDAVALTQELVRIDTRNPPGDEAQCVECVADLLSGCGMSVAVHEFGPRRMNVVAGFPKRPGREDRPSTMFTGHVDTVPLGTASWSMDPFGGEIRDGRLYGRGSSDMKAGIAAMIAATAAEADRLRERPDLVLVFTGGEETGCDGARALVDDRMLGPASLLVVGEPTGNRMLAGHKGALWLRARFSGRTAHGSMPELGINAIYKASHAAATLETFEFNCRRHPVLGGATLNVGTISGGQNINSVPDHAELTIDVRTLPGMDHAAIADQLQFALGDGCAISTIVDLPAVWTDPRRVPAGGSAGGVRPSAPEIEAPMGANYFTDASVLTPALGGPDTLICGPGEPGMAHQTDEYCETAKILESVAIYRAIIDGRLRDIS